MKKLKLVLNCKVRISHTLYTFEWVQGTLLMSSVNDIKTSISNESSMKTNSKCIDKILEIYYHVFSCFVFLVCSSQVLNVFFMGQLRSMSFNCNNYFEKKFTSLRKKLKNRSKSNQINDRFSME